jgi:phosphopantothenoylcysteine decarboxylase/phosphopantothenate--cysteine ligase
LETENEIENAKLNPEKNLDLIVLNSLQDQGAGFETTIKLPLLIGTQREPMELKLKEAVADDI